MSVKLRDVGEAAVFLLYEGGQTGCDSIWVIQDRT